MRAIIYARLSSDPQGKGRSVAEQEAECRAVCERNDWHVTEVIADNHRSASRHAARQREGFNRLLGIIDAGGADVVVCWEASRLARDLAVFAKLREACAVHGILWSYSGRVFDPRHTFDRFMTGLDALLAEHESDRTRDRVQRAVTANAAAGRPHGKNLFGYRRVYDDKRRLVDVVVVEEEAALVREAAKRVAAGETCYAIAQSFNARGLTTPRGAQWNLTQVRRVVSNPGYIGKRVFQGSVAGDAIWPPILDEEVFWACRRIFADPRRKTVRDAAVRYLLSGIVTCAECGGRMGAQRNRGYHSYICLARFCVSVRTEKLDGFVGRLVIARLSRPDARDLFAPPDHGNRVARARAKVVELRERLDGFYRAAVAGELSPAALARVEAALAPQLAAAEQQAAAPPVPHHVRPLLVPDVAAVWERLPIAAKRAVIDELLSIRLKRTGIGRRGPLDPQRVEVEWKQA